MDSGAWAWLPVCLDIWWGLARGESRMWFVVCLGLTDTYQTHFPAAPSHDRFQRVARCQRSVFNK
jgi:hypothetical protein